MSSPDHFARHQLDAAELDRLLGVPAAAGRRIAAFIRACCSSRVSLLVLLLQRADAHRELAWAGVEQRRGPSELVAIALERRQRLEPGNRLDAPDAGSHAAFRHDGEQADIAGRADMGASAQLHAEAGNGDDAHAIAVLLAEERHGAGGHRLLRRLDLGRARACCCRICSLTMRSISRSCSGSERRCSGRSRSAVDPAPPAIPTA